MSQPFFRQQNQTWYFWEKSPAGRRQVALGKDKAAAFKAWHKRQAQTEPVTKDSTVQTVTDRFLKWCDRHRSAKTAKWYRGFLTPFVDAFGKLPVSKLTAAMVEDWIDEAYGTCSDNGRNGAVRAITRPFNWAIKRGLLTTNPIAGVERPAPQSREAYIQPEQWNRLLAATSGDLHDLLTVLRETGCRPHEARIVESRHVDRASRAWRFDASEGKGGRPRAVPLTDAAWAITQRLMIRYPDGPLFRNTHGTPWTKDALGRTLKRLARRTGVKATPYAIRHTYVTDALANGVDPVTVATIVGHRGLDMIMRVYQHVQLRTDHIQASLRKAIGG